MSSTEKQVDVVIVGGGMVGATLACALGDSPLKVALLEAGSGQYRLPQQGYALRVSAITRASQRIFEALGVWDKIAAYRITPYRDMHVWDASGSGVIHFDSAELGEADLGHIIENDVISMALYERLSAFQNVELMTGAEFKEINITPENASVTLKSGETIKTRLIIGADGSRSAIRQRFGIGVRGWDYDQTAVVTYVKTQKSHAETAWQRFLPTGPLAFLPLPEAYSSIVWSTTPEQAQQLLAMDDATFCHELAAAFGHTLGEIESTGPRAAFPLRFFLADNFIGERLALVGDAAHTIHPLAGQGVNLGLADVASLAEVLLDAHAAGRDIGSSKVLRRYERWRRADSLALLVAMDGIKRLFGSDMPALRWLRNFGLSLTHKAAPVKNQIVRSAMGLHGSLPRLSRGLPLSGGSH